MDTNTDSQQIEPESYWPWDSPEEAKRHRRDPNKPWPTAEETEEQGRALLADVMEAVRRREDEYDKAIIEYWRGAHASLQDDPNYKRIMGISEDES